MKTALALARQVALSCRILAKLGMFKETTGHVSARLDKEHMLIRGRGPKETGLLFTKPSDVIVADLDGRNRDKKAGLKPPNEAVIHGEIYKARANTAAVVIAKTSVAIEIRRFICVPFPASLLACSTASRS